MKVTVLLKKLVKNCFDEIFFSDKELLVFSRCGNYGNLLFWQKFRESNAEITRVDLTEKILDRVNFSYFQSACGSTLALTIF